MAPQCPLRPDINVPAVAVQAAIRPAGAQPGGAAQPAVTQPALAAQPALAQVDVATQQVAAGIAAQPALAQPGGAAQEAAGPPALFLLRYNYFAGYMSRKKRCSVNHLCGLCEP